MVAPAFRGGLQVQRRQRSSEPACDGAHSTARPTMPRSGLGRAWRAQCIKRLRTRTGAQLQADHRECVGVVFWQGHVGESMNSNPSVREISRQCLPLFIELLTLSTRDAHVPWDCSHPPKRFDEAVWWPHGPRLAQRPRAKLEGAGLAGLSPRRSCGAANRWPVSAAWAGGLPALGRPPLSPKGESGAHVSCLPAWAAVARLW